MDVFADNAVAIASTQPRYPRSPPYHPPEKYPESPFSADVFDETNTVYEAVRQTLRLLGLDECRYGKKDWNPLGAVIQPGDDVVVKPNFVLHYHPRLHEDIGFESLVTQTSILRAIIDYVHIALGDTGSITVADTPLDFCDFPTLINRLQLPELVEYYQEQDLDVAVHDLRRPKDVRAGVSGGGDPKGYVDVDLGRDSSLASFDEGNPNYYTTADQSVDPLDPHAEHLGTPNQYHNKAHHVYNVPKTIMDADAVVSVAKLKTHVKAGVTLSLKNMIGIISHKDHIPHFRQGTPPVGDASPVAIPRSFVYKRRIARAIESTPIVGVPLIEGTKGALDALGLKNFVYKKYIDLGDWHGNDTLWRTIIDINKILIYADSTGILKDTPQRKYLAFLDGVVGGDDLAPLHPTPRKSGLVFAGFNPLSVDSCATRAMGFDPEKIILMREASRLESHRLGSIDEANITVHANLADSAGLDLSFTAPPGYRGRIEKTAP